MDAQGRLEGVVSRVGEVMFARGVLDERQRRLLAGCIADGYGRGGVKAACEATGLDYRTVRAGADEARGGAPAAPAGRVRREGAGRPSCLDLNPDLDERVAEVLETNTYGDPGRVLTWTNLSLRKISSELSRRFGLRAGKDAVAASMARLGYSRQRNRKAEQVGEDDPDRDRQFRFINSKSAGFIAGGLPVVSCDTKKKELIGDFRNAGAEWRPSGEPRRVLDHDFGRERVSPYGACVLNDNTAFVSLGTGRDTSSFAVEGIRRWWRALGEPNFGGCRRIYVVCDGGGSNGWRVRLWKHGLAELARETGLEIHVSHMPTGCSKWNKVEHRLFCYITKNWEGKPLVDVQTTVSLIRSTTTASGLAVSCEVDDNVYEAGVKVPDDEFGRIDVSYVGPHRGWNYIIRGFKDDPAP